MQNYLIVCAGSTVKAFRKKIQSYINSTKPIVIGINNVSHMFKLDYHLWTNYRRFKSFYSGDYGNLILSVGLYDKLCEKKLFGFGEIDVPNITLISDDMSKWRTAGIRAIQFVQDINGTASVVGMDGYSYKYNGNQHCYGTGNTDSENEAFCLEKDNVMYDNMRVMKKSGVEFRILTPTYFEEFYDGSVIKV